MGQPDLQVKLAIMMPLLVTFFISFLTLLILIHILCFGFAFIKTMHYKIFNLIIQISLDKS